MERRSRYEDLWDKLPNVSRSPKDTKRTENSKPVGPTSTTAKPATGSKTATKLKTDKPPIAFPIAFPFLRDDPLATGVPTSPFRKTAPKPLTTTTTAAATSRTPGPRRIGPIKPAVPLIPFTSSSLAKSKNHLNEKNTDGGSSSSKAEPKKLPASKRVIAVATPLLTKKKLLNPESPPFEVNSGSTADTTTSSAAAKSKSISFSSDFSPFPSFKSRLSISKENKELPATNGRLGAEQDVEHNSSSDHEIPEPPTPETSFGDSTVLFGTETTKVKVYIITGDITGRGPTETKHFHRDAYTSICSTHPFTVEESELSSFLSTVMHDETLWLNKRWSCNLCTKTALHCKSYANPYLEFDEPLVVVFQLPVCKNELCANAAEALYTEMMNRMNGSPPFLREGRCITCARDCSTRVISSSNGGDGGGGGSTTTTTTAATEARSKYKMCQGCTRDCQKKVWPEYNNARQRERRGHASQATHGVGEMVNEENLKGSEGITTGGSTTMRGDRDRDRPRFISGGTSDHGNRNGGSGRTPGSRRSGGRSRRH